MKPTKYMKRLLSGTCVVLCGIAFAPLASATSYFDTVDIYDTSTFSSVPVAYSNANPSSLLPITSVQIANDSTNLYVLLTFATPTNGGGLSDGSSIQTAIDNDANTSTGYNTFGESAVGSDVLFSYDFPVAQTSSLYNAGGTFTAGEGIVQYNQTSSQESFYIPLNDAYTFDGTTYLPVFPGSNLALGFYDGNSSATFTGAIDYTLATATAPEPSTVALMVGGLGLLVLMGRRRLASSN